ncbi:kinase-like protein [Cylindrobasidium torrendii FP15055 ss-10]|uniref:cAMP-dependent protein kinase n=1 Tax=Cylindrobasidium torrendii FP15055 ss-10 TaxID=1314674 RepID=A0A0D7BPT4_9AGAR|nr:kinase-like protein [Cylindrobasidium torrendii FP15055 ss-10]
MASPPTSRVEIIQPRICVDFLLRRVEQRTSSPVTSSVLQETLPPKSSNPRTARHDWLLPVNQPLSPISEGSMSETSNAARDFMSTEETESDEDLQSAPEVDVQKNPEAHDMPSPIEDSVFVLDPDKSMDTTISEDVRSAIMSFEESTDLLARGEYGDILRVQCRRGAGIFALKIVKKKQIFEDFRKVEFENARWLHQNRCHDKTFIVEMLSTDDDMKEFRTIMEYISGGTLEDLIQIRGLEDSSAKLYAAEITLAISHLHSENIVHRNLNPQNVLIDSAGHIKLAGLNRATIPLISLFPSPPRRPFASPYMSVHQRHGRPHSFEEDWFALGMCVYTMFVGCTPDAAWPADAYRLPLLAHDFYCRVTTSAPNTWFKTKEKGGGDAVRAHIWFDNIDWDDVARKTIPAPMLARA